MSDNPATPPTPPESAFSMNWSMIDENGADVQVTMRAATLADMKELFEKRRVFMEYNLSHGWKLRNKITSSPEVPTAPGPQPTAQSTNSGEAVCSMIEVGTAYKSGKTQLKFHCNGFEHPLTYTREIGDMAKLLAPIGYNASHIVVGQKYGANCLVKWEENGKYKNVVSVRVP